MSRTAAGAVDRSRTSEERAPRTPPPFFTGLWRDLAILNYEVDPAVLARRVPKGCELDDWNGRHFVTLIGFRVLHAKVLGIALPFHSDFLEVDFHFYVRRLAGTWRRGIVSIKELTPRRLVAFVARQVYGENFVTLPMRHALLSAAGQDTRMYTYGWRRTRAWESLSVRSTGAPLECSRDSEERFITDRYLGFTRRKDGTFTYQVEHAPWRLYRGDAATLDADVPLLYGQEFMEALCFPPRLALTADGSSVIVRRRRRIG
jgi:uncharacterized protein YqjF (DUF2071 family)